MIEIAEWLVYLCCPTCEVELLLAHAALLCERCDSTFPIIAGIPDLRTVAARPGEAVRVAGLLERYAACDFRELMREHVAATTEPDLLEVELDYELEWARRGAKQLYRVESMARDLAGAPFSVESVPGLYVDVGCGKGAMLATMAGRCERGIGVDTSLEYLILARKLLDELGADNTLLVAGSNLALPIRSGCARLLTSIDVIEHIPDQSRGMAEDMRVLEPDGVVFMNSPNRYSLFAVEDHVRLWGVGFVPRRWAETYVRMLSGRGYDDVWLLSYRALRHLAREHADSYAIRGILFDPSSPDLSGKERLLVRSSSLVSLLDAGFKLVLPSHQLMMRKAGAYSETDGPADVPNAA